MKTNLQKTVARGEGGLTLIELLVVVAIIGIISAAAVTNMQSALDKSRQRKTLANMRNLSTAISAYNTDYSELPGNGLTASELEDLLEGNVFNTVDATDAWGYDLAYSSNAGSYTVESYARDGADGPANITPATKTEFDNDMVLVDGRFLNSPEI